MKNILILFTASVFCLWLLNSCGGATEQERTEKNDQTHKQEMEKAEPGLTMKLNGEALHFDNAEHSYDEMFGPQLTISAFLTNETEEVGAITTTTGFFSINIEDVEVGEMQTVNISLRDYNVGETSATVKTFETGSGMFGTVVEEVSLKFSATVYDDVGEALTLTGTYVK